MGVLAIDFRKISSVAGEKMSLAKVSRVETTNFRVSCWGIVDGVRADFRTLIGNTEIAGDRRTRVPIFILVISGARAKKIGITKEIERKLIGTKIRATVMGVPRGIAIAKIRDIGIGIGVTISPISLLTKINSL